MATGSDDRENMRKDMHPDARAILDRFGFEKLPVEGTFYRNTWRSVREIGPGAPAGTAMLGLYCNEPLSASCFHRLAYDEVWHFYSGDPLALILLHPDGTSGEVVLGSDILSGQICQFVVPAHTWQAGSLCPGGRYALFGCTMAPGFTGAIFEAGIASDLIRQYPGRAADIERLSINGSLTRMPKDFM
jgi:predicted cupin superfamily sugar epimerase